jgi:hypothetical protein
MPVEGRKSLLFCQAVKKKMKKKLVSTNMKRIEDYLDELCQVLFAAKRYYEMWWVLCGDSRPKNVDVMNQYIDCSRGLIGATFDAGMVALCKAIDTRSGTNNIYKIFERLESSNKFTAADIQSYKTRLNAYSSTIKGIKIIRGNAIGHISETLPYFEAFNKADIKIDMWKSLLNELIEIVCDIYLQQARVHHRGWFNNKAATQLDGMFDDLKKFHAITRE